MTDIELTKACAEKMGFTITGSHWGDLPIMTSELGLYDPLHDNEQAMFLVKRFELDIEAPRDLSNPDWEVYRYTELSPHSISSNANLNRAIVECVAALKARTDSAILEAK